LALLVFPQLLMTGPARAFGFGGWGGAPGAGEVCVCVRVHAPVIIGLQPLITLQAKKHCRCNRLLH